MDNNDSTKGLLGGFEAIFSDEIITTNVEETEEDVIEDAAEEVDDDDIPVKKEKTTSTKTSKVKDEPEKNTGNDDVLDEEEYNEEDSIDNQEDEIDNNESTAVTGLFDAIAEQLGWDVSNDEDKPKDAESLVKYFQETIEESSKPTYASEEVKALDEFVKNGGKLEDFFKIETELDIEDLDIENESHQKKIVSDYLREKGLSNEQIKRKITKYEDAGILEDEAEDALEALRDIKEQKKEQLLEEQKKAVEVSKRRQQEFYTSVVNEINSMKDIRGINIPEADKKALSEYIFKPDANGTTKYQKDYADPKRVAKNLIESAYFTMKGDALLSSAKKEGTKNAIKDFKNSLRTAPVTKTRKIISNNEKTSIWDTVAQQLTTKK